MSRQADWIRFLNTCDEDTFVYRLKDIFEHGDWIARRALQLRPLTDREEFQTRWTQQIQCMSEAEVRKLLNDHPDLAGRAAEAGTLTRSSTSEQQSAGLDRLSDDDRTAFRTLNAQYKERFQFPFIVCVRAVDGEDKKNQILQAMRARVQNSVSEELRTALEQVLKIANIRLNDLFNSPFGSPL